jgi:hypothetical protein
MRDQNIRNIHIKDNLRFKEYTHKSTKALLFAGITAASLTFLSGGVETTAKADTTNSSSETITNKTNDDPVVTPVTQSTTSNTGNNTNNQTNTGTDSQTGSNSDTGTNSNTGSQNNTDTNNSNASSTGSNAGDTTNSKGSSADGSTNNNEDDTSNGSTATPLSAPVSNSQSNTGTTSNESAPVTTDQTDSTQTDDQTIDQWMPNKTLQTWVLRALNTPGDRVSDYTGTKVWNSVDDITKDDMLILNQLSNQHFGTTYIDGKTEFSLEGLPIR